MCFVLYIASDSPIPDVPFDADAPALNTHPLTEHESPVRRLFDQLHVKYLGSSNQCGCGFRRLSFQNDDWPEEYLIGVDPEFGAGTQADHDSLYRFLSNQLQSSDRIQLYGCWDGDFKFPAARRELIRVDDVIGIDFFLRERCLYDVVSNQ